VRFLIIRGADLELTNREVFTPLHVAVYYPQPEIGKLIYRNPNPNPYPQPDIGERSFKSDPYFLSHTLYKKLVCDN
jgi:ankyrin repeat protein